MQNLVGHNVVTMVKGAQKSSITAKTKTSTKTSTKAPAKASTKAVAKSATKSAPNKGHKATAKKRMMAEASTTDDTSDEEQVCKPHKKKARVAEDNEDKEVDDEPEHTAEHVVHEFDEGSDGEV
jgi:hypothetical protein